MNKAVLLVVALSLLTTLAGFFIGPIAWGKAFDSSIPRFWFIWITGAYAAECFVQGRKALQINNIFVLLLLYILSVVSIILPITRFLTIYLITLTMLSFFELVLYSVKMNFDSRIAKGIISVGVCSYSIYLIHQPYLNGLFSYFLTYSKVQNQHLLIFLKVIPSFAVIYLVAYAMHMLIEKPFIEMGERMRAKKGGTAIKVPQL
jgi:peptidoglycan/LPS O-acetylase OafA/YrhL